MKKYIICGCLASLISLGVCAQGGTNSPYSQYGIGVLSDASQGFSRGMNGASLGLRKGNIVNTLNPASYSAVDSLTMIFDIGAIAQITNFKEGAAKVNAQNANFEYAVGAFQLLRGVGMSFGIQPYSNVGYKYTSATRRVSDSGAMYETYSGEGGLRQAFIGAGWSVTPRLSVGANIGYMWGTTNRSVLTNSSSYINTLSKTYSSTVKSYDATFGLQWQQPMNVKDMLTFGVTMGLGHKLGADATCQIVDVNSADTTTMVVGDALSLPMTYAFGVAWNHGDQLVVDADFTLQKWGSLDFPANNSATDRYELMSGLLKDRYQVKMGADYVPNGQSRNLFKRIHYRVGAGFATPYYYINGKNGPKELSLSAGFGIPLQNVYNNRSVLNVSAQWVHTSAADLITENTFRISLGLTFNERWFAKWKIE